MHPAETLLIARRLFLESGNQALDIAFNRIVASLRASQQEQADDWYAIYRLIAGMLGRHPDGHRLH